MHRIIFDRWRVTDAAEAAGISERSAYKWLARFMAGGARMLHDRRSSCPVAASSRHSKDRGAAAVHTTGQAIADRLAIPRFTVGTVLRELGLGRLSALDPAADYPLRVREARRDPT